MDEDARLVQRFKDSVQALNRQEVMSAAQAANNELRIILNKHLTEHAQIMLETLKDLIDDIDIQQIILSRSPDSITSGSQLGASDKFKATTKLLPNLLDEYHRTLHDIRKPFSDNWDALVKCNSTSEVQAQKALFLSQMHFLNPYFDYPDGTNGKLPTSQITAKQTLLNIANSVAEQATISFEQQELARIQEQERIRAEEKDQQKKLLKAEEDQQKSKMTMKEMITKMKKMEELLAQKDKIIDKMISKKDVDQLMRDNERSLKEKDIKNEFIKDRLDTALEKNLEQKDRITDLKQDKHHLQEDKLKLNKYTDKLEFQLSEFAEVIKQKDKLGELLPAAIDESYIESSLSVINLEQNNLDLDISGNAHSIEETDV
jgi:hypothetical protein